MLHRFDLVFLRLGIIFQFIILLCASKNHFPKLSEFKRSLSQNLGSKLKIFCSPQEGDRPFRFEWLKDGHRLLPSDRHRIEAVEDDSLLIIDHLKSSDGGNYSCKVENSAGSDLQWTQLLLKGDED